MLTKNYIMKRLCLVLMLSVISVCGAVAQVTVTATGGTVSQVYGNVGLAFNAINSGVHTGTINIGISGTISETGSCVLHSSGAGSASYTSVRIFPEVDGSIVQGATVQGKGLIELNGADNVTIDGDNPNTPGTNRNLTFTNTAANTITLTSVIRIAVNSSVSVGNADNITIKNCIINGSATNASFGVTGTVADNTMGIYGGGIVTPGGGATTAPTAITAVNTRSTGTMHDLVIDNNMINACARGISINSNSKPEINNLTVTNNTIGNPTNPGIPPYSVATTGVYAVAITLQGATMCTVNNNTVYVASANTGPLRGMEIQGNSAATLVMQNNTVGYLINTNTTPTAAEGIFFDGITVAATVTGNTIKNVYAQKAAVAATGINWNNAGSFPVVIEGNNISRIYNYAATASPAIGILFGNVTGSNNVVVRNNFISDITTRTGGGVPSTTNEAMGIKIAAGAGYKLYNNTIHMNASPISGTTASANTCLMVSTTGATGMDIRNNIFSMQMAGWPASAVNSCIQFPTGLTTSFNCILNNNAYYAGSNGVIAQMTSGTTTYTAANFVLNATTPATNWRAYSSGFSTAGTNDNASLAITAAPTFVGGADLHFIPAGATPLESGGANLGVTTDIDGDVRPGPVGSVNGGATFPDIGADEFDGIPLDVVPPSITYTALAGTCVTSDRTINVTIADSRGVPTSGLDMPRIYYRKGAGAWFSAVGVLSSGTATNGVWTFTISATDMGGLTGADMVSYYVIAQDAALNIGASPAAGFLATSVNSVTTPPSSPSTYFVQPSSGTVDVGVGKPFTTITAAVNSYNTNTCLTGHLVYQLTDASYPTESYPINIGNNPLAAAGVTLTIKPAPANAATITGGVAAGSMIKLTDAKYVTIDGVNAGGASLTLINNQGGNNQGNIWIASSGSGCNNITLTNLKIVGGAAVPGGASADGFGIVAATPTGSIGRNQAADNDNITITGNYFVRCGYAIWASGTTATSAGGLDNWVVNNNIIGPATGPLSSDSTMGVNGLFFRNMVNISFSNNLVRNIGSTTNTTFAAVAVNFENGVNRAVIRNNVFDGSYVIKASSTASALVLGGSVINSIVSGNTFKNIVCTGSSSTVRALQLGATVANCNDTIVNNTITDVYGLSGATALSNWPVGILVDGSGGSGYKIWHNTVNLFGPHGGAAGNSGSACMYINNSGGSMDLRNNIFVNTYDNTGSTTEKNYALYSVQPNTVFSSINNNNYYVTGAGNDAAFISGNACADITAIRTFFGGNTNSMSIAPGFVSSTDLHIAGGVNSGLESAGANLGITADMDGDARPGPAGSVNGGGTLPDIGADEFDGIPVDAVLPSVAYTPLTSSCTAGDRVITATISDNMGIVATGADVPRVYARKNGGVYVSSPGVLLSGDALSSVWSFTISATAFTPALTGGDQVSYFVVAQDAGNNVAGFPGAGVTGSNVNTVTPPTVPSVYNVFPASGTFEVGVGKNYSTITAAVNAYNANTCLTGHIVYLLTDATYLTESYPINIMNNPLAGPSVTMTIKPSPGVAVTVSGSAPQTSAMFKFSDARYITIDGVNAGGSSLSLINTNTTQDNNANIWLSSSGLGNKFITLTNLNITGGANVVGSSASLWAIIACGTTTGNNSGADNDNITITNNTFLRTGYAILANGNAAISTGGNDNWVVNNNILGPAVRNATDGMGVNAMFFKNMLNLDLSNNEVRNLGASFFSPACFYLETNVNRVTMRNNTIDGIVSAVSGTTQVVHIGGGVVNSIFSGNIFRNISSTSTSWSMRVFNVFAASPTCNDTIVNNVITGVAVNGGTSATANWPIGIHVDGVNTGGLKIWHNSINFANSYNTGNVASGSACIYIPNTSGLANIDIRNNVLVNTYDNTGGANDKHYAIYSAAPASIFSNIDHNDYFVTGGATLSALGFLGSDRTTVAAMQTGFGGNTHSVNAAPNFVSAADLHITPHVMTPLESGAANVGVTTDKDGTTRPGATTHSAGLFEDMGAYEFDGILQDVVPPSITYTPLTGGCGVGDRTLVATITDATGVNNTTTFKPRIYYKLSSAGSYTLSQQGVSLGGNQWMFTIVAADMPTLANGNIVQYFIVAQDNVTPTANVGSTPGAGLVAPNVNTITTPPTTPSSYQIFPSMGGNYTVGAGGGTDFTTITSAVAAYNAACLNDHVTFTLMDAAYGSSESYPIIINNNAFADADHTLTIRPAASQTVTVTSNPGAAAIFKLSNARFVTIDGLNTGGSVLNLVNGNGSATTNTCNIWLGSTAAIGAGVKNITIRNLNITGNTNTTASGWGIVASSNGSIGNNSTGGDNDNVTIMGNTFLRCGYAILASGSSVASAGANDNWLVKNNIVGPAVSDPNTNMGVNAMFFRNMANLEVSDNVLRNVGTPSANFGTAGVYMEANINRAVVRRNTITNLTSISTGSSIGIHVGTGVVNSLISGNTISGCVNTNTSGGSMRAINVNANSPNINDTIVNNMISDVYAYSFNALPTTATNRWPIGMLIESSGTGSNAGSGLCVWHNTVNMYGGHPGVSGNGGSAALLILSSPANALGGINMRNNIFSNTSDNTGSATDKTYAVWALSAPPTLFSVINNNSYYAAAQNSVLLGVGATDITSLSGIQSSLGGNANSVVAAPSFVADNNPHLRLVNANYPFVAGTPIAQVSMDIDGTARNAVTPFMGAHEAEKCNGTVVAGTAVPVAPAICVSGVTTLNNTTSTPGIGVMLQWQSSEDSAAFTSINGATNESYTIPADITVSTYYRMKANCVFTGNADSTTTKVPVYPLPAVITGADACFSYTTTLGNADAGGNWNSSNTSVATITAGGVVSGLTTGTTVISYTLPSTGCTRTRTLTVNPLPAAITGTPKVCVNGSTDLENADANGTWSSGATSIATVDGTTGVVSGVSAGLVNISYTLPTGCFMPVAVSVDPLPAISVSAATPGVVCLGESAAFTATSPLSVFTLLSQDFNGATIGDWTVDNLGGDPAAYWQQVPVGYDAVTTGDGTKMMQAVPLITGMPVQTILNSPSFSTLNVETATLTFNQYRLSDVIDAKLAVEYSTDGGSNWQTLSDFTGTSSPATETGTWSATVALTTVALPVDAINKASVKLRWNYDGYIHWFVDNVTVKGTLPAATFAWTAPSSISEVSCPTCATTTVTPTTSGNVVYTVTAVSSAGCRAPINATVSVNPLPQAITGNGLQVCHGLTVTLSSADAGGTWVSDNTTNVTIDATSGVATGHVVGTSTITYTLPTGCITTAVLTVNPLPVAIGSATMQVCPGNSITLTNTDAGGTWSSNDDAIAAVNATTGVVTGVSANTTTITYTLPTGCISTATITVNPLPQAIGGTLAVCKGLSATLTNADAGGTWSSNDDAIAIIDETTGVATGISANTTTVTYTLPTGCINTAVLTVNALPVAIGGATMQVCPGSSITLTDADAGGTWSSNDDAIATVDETTGEVAGVSANTTTITYTLGTGCINTAIVTVNPLPAAIGGPLTVCNGLSVTLTNTSGGGSWSSNDDAIATIDATTGVATGVSANVTTVTYTLPTGCLTTAALTVNPLPVAITGPSEVCVNSNITLANTDLGGTWSSGTPAIATVGTSGVVTGVVAGNVVLTYTLPTSCITSYEVTVNPLPVLHSVTGGGSYCAGSTGVNIGLASSETGTDYSLYNGATFEATEAGTTGSVIDFGIYTVAGTYTVSATTSFGCTRAMPGSATVVITPTVLPAVTIGASSAIICQGATATFTATPANGGTAPAYQWTVNGSPVTGTNTYSYAPVNGDVVSVSLTSNAVCPLPATVTSAPFAVTVTNTLTPSVSIVSNIGSDICEFSSVIFTATPVNGGAAPTYTWTRNGTNVGTAASTLTIVPSDNDVILAKLNSSYACPSANGVSSNSITMNVTDVFLPVVKIETLPGIVTKLGQTVTLNATVTPAGHSATYQWYKNTTKLAGATNATYISADFANGDSVTVTVTGVGECAYNSFNSVRMYRSTGVVNVHAESSIRLMPNPNTGAFTVTGALAAAADAEVTMEVTNMLGQTVHTVKTVARKGVIEEKLTLSNTVANGMYMLTVYAADERRVFHFVLSK